VFFVQVRPSPWRQAVDLGNMMLVLALRSDAELVYRKALAYFTPEELSEAFAATRGVASPTQLRNFMKQDSRDLLEEFRALAPPRDPVGTQRWSLRRVGLIVLTLIVVVLAGTIALSLFFPNRGQVLTPSCGTNRTTVLMAQAVPTAEQVPCIHQLPLGWSIASASVIRGRATILFRVGPGRGPGVNLEFGGGDDEGAQVQVVFLEVCPSAGDPGTQVLDVGGGCVTYRSALPEGVGPVPSFDEGGGLAFVQRSDLVAFVESQEDLTLCGADAPPCP
jgi:hypothetical protein